MCHARHTWYCRKCRGKVQAAEKVFLKQASWSIRNWSQAKLSWHYKYPPFHPSLSPRIILLPPLRVPADPPPLLSLSKSLPSKPLPLPLSAKPQSLQVTSLRGSGGPRPGISRSVPGCHTTPLRSSPPHSGSLPAGLCMSFLVTSASEVAAVGLLPLQSSTLSVQVPVQGWVSPPTITWAEPQSWGEAAHGEWPQAGAGSIPAAPTCPHPEHRQWVRSNSS